MNVLEIESVGLALLLHFVEQLLPKLGVLHRIRRADDQISLPSHWHVASLRTPVSIGMIEARNRHARHQEVAQDPILDHLDLCCRHAFVVVFVPAGQPRSIQRAQRRVIGDGKELRQYGLVQFLCKSLPFFAAALPLAFQPVSQYLVEEDPRGTAGEQRGTIVGLGHRSFAQSLQILGHPLDLCINLCRAG